MKAYHGTFFANKDTDKNNEVGLNVFLLLNLKVFEFKK